MNDIITDHFILNMIWIVFKRINEKSKLEIPEFVFPVQFTIENGSGLYKVNKWRGGEGSWWQGWLSCPVTFETGKDYGTIGKRVKV